ncbi:MAG: hypothetical protein ACRYFS_12270 [Janthinobacterium lividum]
MSVLPLTIADLKPLCAIETADTSSDADLTLLLTAQQPALEYGLDVGILAASAGDSGLQATLMLGVAEALAGEFLRRQSRAPGATDDFHLGPLTVSASRTESLSQLGDRLAALGLKRLEPFGRASKRVAYDASAGLPDGSSKSPLLLQTDASAACASSGHFSMHPSLICRLRQRIREASDDRHTCSRACSARLGFVRALWRDVHADPGGCQPQPDRIIHTDGFTDARHLLRRQ